MVLTEIGRGTRARSEQVNQLIRVLNGDESAGSLTVGGQLTLQDAGGTDTDNYLVRSATDTIDLYVGGVRKLRVEPERITIGGIDYTDGDGPVPYGVWETVYPIDVNNAPKARLPGVVIEEVVDDPAEFNLRRGGQLTPGGAHVDIPDSTPIGFGMIWGWGGGAYRKLVQIAVKNTEAITGAANHGAMVSVCTVPNGTNGDPRPGITQGPDRRVLLDDALTSLDNTVWNTAYGTGIEERFAIRGDNDPGMTTKNKATVASGNKVRFRHQFTTTNDAWAAGNGGFQIETNVTQASPLKTETTLSVNTGAAATVGMKIRDDGKATFPVAILTAAMVRFSVSGGVVTVNASHNVTSVVRNSVGSFTVNFTAAIATGDHIGLATARGAVAELLSQSTALLNVTTKDYAGAVADPTSCHVIVMVA